MDATGETSRTERRRSLGRVFTKFRDAMKRRSSSGRALATAQTTTTQTPPTIATMETPNTVAASEQEDVSAARALPADLDRSAAKESAMRSDARLVLQTGEIIEVGNDDEEEWTVTPLKLSTDNSRAKAIFDRYGFTYSRADSTLVDNSKRVQKAMRIRIHWTCHQCGTGFGIDKLCANCHHERCQQCPRVPHKRIREALKGTAELKEVDKKIADSTEDQEIVVVPVTASKEVVDHIDEADDDEEIVQTASTSPLQALQPLEPAAKLEMDENMSEDDIDIAQIQYVFQNRTRSVNLVHRPKSQIIRRTCHECQAEFNPASRTDCQNCGHLRCSSCPRYPPKRDKWPLGSPGDEPAPDSAFTVNRVYRPTKQRVRWSCHSCGATFQGTYRCGQCTHERCANCTRYPPIRVRPPPNPDIVLGLADRLAELNNTLAAQNGLLNSGPSTASANFTTATV